MKKTKRKSLNIRNVEAEIIITIKQYAKDNELTMARALKELIEGEGK